MSDDFEDDFDRDISKYEYDAMLDAAAEGEALMRHDARDDRDRWRDRVDAELRELEARRAGLPAPALDAVDDARRELDAIEPDEEPELVHDERDPPTALYVFFDAEERLERAEYLIARARVTVETGDREPPTAPTWDDLTGQAALFPLEGGAVVRSSADVRRPATATVRAHVKWRARNVCEVCRSPALVDEPLEFGHIVSLEDGVRLGVPEAALNSMDNLILECRDCNRGHGGETLPPWLAVAILRARADRRT